MITDKLSVFQFNSLAKQHLESLGILIIEGEIVQMAVTSRGGLSIELKDPDVGATVRVSGYAPKVQGINFCKEGDLVQIWGTPTLWESRGLFSINPQKIMPVGEGALKEAFLKLQSKLSAEGLFAEERKRPLPEFLLRIALITAKNSAAETDFLKILKENDSALSVDFYPVLVQGNLSEAQIISALKAADTNDYDCIVLTRGGGSLEDLIAFNDEELARTIFSLKTPVLVAVGHERDESIADYVADIRASTPSQAAYYLASQNIAFIRSQEKKAEAFLYELENRINSQNFKLAKSKERINMSIEHWLRSTKDKLGYNLEMLNKSFTLIATKIENKINQKMSLISGFINSITRLSDQVKSTERLLQSLNPQNILNKGYAIVLFNGKAIDSIDKLSVNQDIHVRLKDGDLKSNILEINKNE